MNLIKKSYLTFKVDGPQQSEIVHILHVVAHSLDVEKQAISQVDRDAALILQGKQVATNN